VCHISTKESVALIRDAKKSGVNITCETGPHYLVLDDSYLQEHGRFKMNPPLRSMDDRKALVEGICDGTVDMIATDHAPHSAEEKSKGLEKSAFGVVGLETAFAVMNTYFVKTGIISLEKLTELMSVNALKRFNIPMNGLTIWNLDKEFIVNPDEFLSLGRATPFEGMKLFGECVATYCNGKLVYNI
jgi:dihydroorotase